MALLEVRNLQTHFRTDDGLLKAVNGISYYVDEAEIVALVGESGCGKSISQLSTMRLVPDPPGRIVGGQIFLRGEDLLSVSEKRMQSIRGCEIAMVFQEPMTSLNPVLPIWRQMTEVFELHLGLNRRAAKKRSVELLELVGIPDAEKRLDDYPHMFSGGMRQRIMIAMALSCTPKLLIADEPTTAVDVTTQAQLLELMSETGRLLKTSIVLVTHNLGTVARYARRIYVMYAGRIVEQGSTRDIFYEPSHPYTVGLLRSVPRLDKPRRDSLVPIDGAPPDLAHLSDICAFLPRCPFKIHQCLSEPPWNMRNVGDGHTVACLANVRKVSS